MARESPEEKNMRLREQADDGRFFNEETGRISRPSQRRHVTDDDDRPSRAESRNHRAREKASIEDGYRNYPNAEAHEYAAIHDEGRSSRKRRYSPQDDSGPIHGERTFADAAADRTAARTEVYEEEMVSRPRRHDRNHKILQSPEGAEAVKNLRAGVISTPTISATSSIVKPVIATSSITPPSGRAH